MQPMRGLNVFRLDRRGHRLTLASWHSPHSLTWRWFVDLSWGWRWRPYAYAWSNQIGGGGWSVWFLCVGLNGQRQAPMWFRDLYQKLSDEDWQRRGMMWLPDNHPHKVHRPPPPPPNPTAPSSATVQ